MSKLYLVQCSSGEWDDHVNIILFATPNIKTAKKYITKANKLVKKYKKFYKQFEDKDKYLPWIKDEYMDYFDRWNDLRKINNIFFNELEMRN